MPRSPSLTPLLRDVRACTICAPSLPEGPRPIVQAHRDATVVIIGQAPGRRVHESGVPWDDPSGDRLRAWLKVDRAAFFDPKRFALVPMGFCFPGSGPSGDLPPRPECAPQWHEPLLERLPNLKLFLLFGAYAQERYLGDRRKKNLTQTVAAWRDYTPRFLPMPHPSPRNQRWFSKNPWFDDEVIPYLRRRLTQLGVR